MLADQHPLVPIVRRQDPPLDVNQRPTGLVLPIVYLAWFEKDTTPAGKEHGEAPLASVLALSVTALLTIALFLYSAPVYQLESQLVRGMP